jgi:hypothetical protein
MYADSEGIKNRYRSRPQHWDVTDMSTAVAATLSVDVCRRRAAAAGGPSVEASAAVALAAPATTNGDGGGGSEDGHRFCLHSAEVVLRDNGE